jgi:hypothetical protein
VDSRVNLDDLEKRKFLPRPGLELRPIESIETNGNTEMIVNFESLMAGKSYDISRRLLL